MNAHEYILAKQINWALNRGIRLVGSKGERGRPAYTSRLEDNLFEPLEQLVRECFEKGDGNELAGSPDSPAKMQAVHSSSALGVNIFQYWQKISRIPEIAAACGLCRKGNRVSSKIVFEEKYPIDESRFQFAPNIDMVIHNTDSAPIRCFGIECKFTEAYASQGHSGLKPEYFTVKEIWQDIPGLFGLAESICPDDREFRNLHAAQLIKHILGLKNRCGKDGFRLLYLWYDAPGEEGANHRKEIERFSKVAKSDGVKFHSLSYQELIMKLSNEYRSDHGEYIVYISERYL